jgi:hypothetical protein
LKSHDAHPKKKKTVEAGDAFANTAFERWFEIVKS